MGGLMSVTGERDGEPGGGPQKVGVPVVDLMTGMYAAVAILAALARRAETGRARPSTSPCSTSRRRSSPTRQ
jgi:crotonobetainyl-CoA:carnitine CoA-transferase CaiB-like acyl-CoA transferase